MSVGKAHGKKLHEVFCGGADAAANFFLLKLAKPDQCLFRGET
ncbi:hypothetical protein [Pyramidobacter sp. CG50-2]|nr:hypothetical protein [Pyramidobacter sp. CG50-2]